MASQDNIWAMVAFFATGIIILVLALVWNSISGVTVLWSQADVGATIQADTQSFVNSWDFIMVCLYIGSHLAILGLAFLLRTHPAMYISALLITILLVVLAAPLSNSFEDITNNPAFTTVQQDFEMTKFIFEKLPLLELMWAVLTMILLYGFARYEGLT